MKRKRYARLLRTVLALVLLVALVPVAWSYLAAVTQPSSLPLSIRTIEWIRDNNGAGFVSFVESVYYTVTAPRKGGPGLAALPAVGLKGTTVPPSTRKEYLPPAIVPVVSPALDGEGVWRETGKQVLGGPPVLVTEFRSEPDYPSQLAYVAWIDTARIQLALYPGRKQPPAAAVRGPMEVPSSQRARLLATFNSGFTYKDSNGGFAVNGRTYEPMVAGQGTVVAYSDGRMDVTTWTGGATVPADVVLARQNLPLIVDGGQPNPRLGNARLWGRTLGNAVRVWRSALGVDARGNLIYVAAPGQTASSLADAIIRAGAVRAVQLDINEIWPSFITYASPGGHGALKLVPNRRQTANRYLVPDDRDFFAVYTRTAGASFSVPNR